MALPLLLGLVAPSLAVGTGISAATAAALGTGLGQFIETGDLEEGIAAGLTGYLGGKALGSMFGGSGKQAADAATATTEAAAATQAPAAVSNMPPLPPTIEAARDAGIQASINPAAAQAASTTAQAAPTLSEKLAQDFVVDPQAITGALYAEAVRMPEEEEEEEKEVVDFTRSEAITREANYPGSVSEAGREFVYFKEGGLASLKGGGFPDLSGDGETTMKDVLIGRGVINKQEGGEMPNDKDIIVMAVDAIKGKSDAPEIALARFVERYGEQSLMDLVERVRTGEFDMNAQRTEGKVNGAGDGMDDMIPATLEGEQDVVLSDGEFIVPADVVSGLGNGSSDAGSKRLYDMMERVRQLRTGQSEQPKQVSPEKMLPA